MNWKRPRKEKHTLLFIVGSFRGRFVYVVFLIDRAFYQPILLIGYYHLLINNIIITRWFKYNVFVHADAIVGTVENERIVFETKGVAR